jgi:transcription elongation factor Elf1
MHSPLLDRSIRCPHCGERVDIVIDVSAGAQSYIEDCQVCCQPMQISFVVHDEEPTSLRVDRA